MFEKLKYILLVLSLSACMGTGPEDQALISAGAMPKGEKVPPPPAFQAYCERNPEDCAIPSSARLNNALDRVNYEVRKIVIPTVEEGDFWQRLDEVGPGDCEDFALTFRHKLRAMFPTYSAAFRLVTAFTEDGQYHAVLSIETNRGTIICDVRFPNCALWTEFPYTWRMREIAGANTWEIFSPEQIETATAAIKARGRR
ncbi:transglutaminase-like cysteine peptidase [Kordiimonas aestuarii]|uniref:transglutaminase-like cysteine peptidase n=1 Tax=Kordiimonas aestuarii TaxID=1005925 RepID=UPI0021CFBDFB|nr:transglutaminase-like cysteine peptidase [Kordiimonas aestuarii]